MGLLEEKPEFILDDPTAPIMSNANIYSSQVIGPDADIQQSLVANGCHIKGTCEHSIISVGCTVEEGAYVKDSILLPGVTIEKEAKVFNAVVGENSVVKQNVVFGSDEEGAEIQLIGNDEIYSGGGAELKNLVGIITANYGTPELNILTNKRTMASLPYSGRYRLIDFPLSNMVNSGINTIGLI